MIYENMRTWYSKRPDKFYPSLKDNVGLPQQRDVFSDTDRKIIPIVFEVKSKETKLHSAIGTSDTLSSERKKRKNKIVTYDISRFMSRSAKVESTKEKFYRFCKRWKRETKHMSCPEDMILHPAYQRIIGLGPSAIPLILAELERELDFWFWALDAISEENPVSDDVQGDMEKMRLAWIQWGRENAYRFGQGIFGRVV